MNCHLSIKTTFSDVSRTCCDASLQPLRYGHWGAQSMYVYVRGECHFKLPPYPNSVIPGPIFVFLGSFESSLFTKQKLISYVLAYLYWLGRKQTIYQTCSLMVFLLPKLSAIWSGISSSLIKAAKVKEMHENVVRSIFQVRI